MSTTTKIMLALTGAIFGAGIVGGSTPYLIFNPSAVAWGVATIAFCIIVASVIAARGFLFEFANGDTENAELRAAISSWEHHAQRLEAKIAAARHPADVLPADVEALRSALGADVETAGRAMADALGRIREFHGLIAALGEGAAKVTAERDDLRAELDIVDEAHARRRGGRMVATIEDEIGRYARGVRSNGNGEGFPGPENAAQAGQRAPLVSLAPGPRNGGGEAGEAAQSAPDPEGGREG